MPKGNSIFNDRRNRTERRQQSLSMPAGLDRRKNDRRHRRFSARDWWLDTDYAVELVGENKNPSAGSGKDTTPTKPHRQKKPEEPSR